MCQDIFDVHRVHAVDVYCGWWGGSEVCETASLWAAVVLIAVDKSSHNTDAAGVKPKTNTTGYVSHPSLLKSKNFDIFLAIVFFNSLASGIVPVGLCTFDFREDCTQACAYCRLYTQILSFPEPNTFANGHKCAITNPARPT